MGIVYNTNVVRDGLIFHYDQANTKKCFKGKPTTNLVDPDFRNWSSITANVSLYKNYSNITRDAIYKLEDDNAAGYEYVQNNLTIPNDSTTYTISVYILKSHPDFDRQSEIAFNTKCTGGTQVSAFTRIETDSWTADGVATVEHIGEYVRWSHQITNNSSGNTVLTFPLFPTSGPNGGSDNSANTGAIFVSGMQVEANDFATPFVNGTRSDTQAVIDLTKNNTLTVSNLEYYSDNTFDFNGNNSRIIFDYNSDLEFAGTLPYSFEAWVKPTGTIGNYEGIINQETRDAVNNLRNGWNLWIHNAGSYYAISSERFTDGSGNGKSFTLTGEQLLDKWHHIAYTFDGTTSTIYHNGVIKNSGGGGGSITSNGNEVNIGSRNGGSYLPASIDQVKIYNRGLSESEVQQNFDAYRDRFGI